MRLLFVCKQFSLRRDVIGDRYWRSWHLPLELARRGHDVLAVAGAYRPGAGAPPVQTFGGGGQLRWISHRVDPLRPWSWLGHRRALHAAAAAFQPQSVLASSDAWHLAAGAAVARARGVPLFADFYDNYESFGASRIPGAPSALRAAARQAAGVIGISAPLARLLQARYALGAPVLVLENAVDPAFLVRSDRRGARSALGLPLDARVVGTAGALDASRGIDVLYGAFARLAVTDPGVVLALAGDAADAPAHPRILRLGTLPPERMPAFWAALDVAAICVRDDAFGRYCFPQKLVEIAAVGTPMVFPRIGVFAEPDADALGVGATADAAAYAEALRRQLDVPRRPAWQPATWAGLAARLDAFLAERLGAATARSSPA